VGHGHSVENQISRPCSPDLLKIASECLQISELGDESHNPHRHHQSIKMMIISRYLRLFSMFFSRIMASFH